MVDVDMEAAKKRKSCEERLRNLNNQWKRKMDEVMRDANKKNEDVKKKLTALCKQRIREAMITVRDDCNKHYKEQLTKIRDDLRKEDRQKSEKMLKLRTEVARLETEVARLKTENAQLSDAVARTAAAMTLSGMPKKRPRTGFIDLGNPLMW